MTAQAGLALVRPKLPNEYNQRVVEQTTQAIERDLQNKYDRRSHLYLPPGKELVITSDTSSAQYGFGIDANGFLRARDMATGVDGQFVINWQSVDGLSQQLVNLETAYEAADGTITNAYIAADAVVTANAAGARAALQTTLETSFAAADTVLEGNLQADIDTRATIVQLTAVESSVNGSIATVSSDLAAETSSRVSGDNSLQADIDTRATNSRVDTVESTLTGSISATSQNLTAETALRVSGDAGLQIDIDTRATNTRVDSVETTLSGSISATATNLTAETSARVSGDAANLAAINVNASDIADNAVDILNRATLSQLTAAETTAASATAAVATSLSAESSARQNADSSLQNDINTRATNTRVDTVETNAASATSSSETTLRSEFQAADSTEASLRASGDSSLQSQVDDRVTTATFNSEVSALTAADTAETTARQTLEARASKALINLFPSQYQVFLKDDYDAGRFSLNVSSASYFSTTVGAATHPSADSVRYAYNVSAGTAAFFNIRPASSAFSDTNLRLIEGARYCFKMRYLLQASQNVSGIRIKVVGVNSTTLYAASSVAVTKGAWTEASIFFDGPAGCEACSFQVVFDRSSTAVQDSIYLNQFQLTEVEAGSTTDPGWASPSNRDAADNTAEVEELKQALATGSSSFARLQLRVNTSSNAAVFEAYAGEGDGVWNGSHITFTANEFRFNGDVIVNGTITADQIAVGSVTVSDVFQSAASTSLTSGSFVDVATLDFTSIGIGVELRSTCDVLVGSFAPGSPSQDIEWQILRGSTVLKSGTVKGASEVTSPGGVVYTTVRGTIIADFNDIPSSGDYTYKLQIKVTNGGGTPTQTASNRYLSAREFKR